MTFELLLHVAFVADEIWGLNQLDSYHKLSSLGRIMFTAFMLNRFVLSHLSPGGRTTPLFFATGSFFAKFVSLSLCAHCV